MLGHCRSFILPEECDYLPNRQMANLFIFKTKRMISLLESDDPVDNTIIQFAGKLRVNWPGTVREPDQESGGLLAVLCTITELLIGRCSQPIRL